MVMDFAFLVQMLLLIVLQQLQEKQFFFANVSCGGTCDGTVTVTAIGNGTISYTSRWFNNSIVKWTLCWNLFFVI